MIASWLPSTMPEPKVKSSLRSKPDRSGHNVSKIDVSRALRHHRNFTSQNESEVMVTPEIYERSEQLHRVMEENARFLAECDLRPGQTFHFYHQGGNSILRITHVDGLHGTVHSRDSYGYAYDKPGPFIEGAIAFVWGLLSPFWQEYWGKAGKEDHMASYFFEQLTQQCPLTVRLAAGMIPEFSSNPSFAPQLEKWLNENGGSRSIQLGVELAAPCPTDI